MLSVREVSKHFGGITAIKDVSFSIEKGAIVSLVGPNGAGKSTLLNVISGVYLPSSGSIIVDGRDITDLSPDKVCNTGSPRHSSSCSRFRNSRQFKMSL